MKMTTFACAIVLTMSSQVLAEDVPFAEPPPSRMTDTDAWGAPKLGDVMIDMQLRHIKLWYAGKAANWALAAYELERMRETIGKAAVLYRNIPVAYITSMDDPLRDMRSAIASKDQAKFSRGYLAFTGACNACHAGGGVGFIHIQAPTSSPFSDENYGSP
jgi:hypothetical protein